MRQPRFLLVVADDFGIGPETTRGILGLAGQGLVTSSVLLVNSPYAEAAVRDWRQAGSPMELGWHPCLTLDGPVLPAKKVASLVAPNGKFWPLGRFIKRVFLGRVSPAEIEAELHAQYERFCDLVGHAPTVVNAHQHCNLFHPIGEILLRVLGRKRPLPYVRRIREPWSAIVGVPGARKKRLFLSMLGRPLSRLQEKLGFAGNDWLMGTTDPPWVKDPHFFKRWLAAVPGDIVELACHPGHLDRTLLGRDCHDGDGLMERRVDEMTLMGDPSFAEACRANGFTLIAPRRLIDLQARRAHAA
jgi:predicted glycoside hydrolase/deacetylase ChbG (UPF0249 family)